MALNLEAFSHILGPDLINITLSSNIYGCPNAQIYPGSIVKVVSVLCDHPSFKFSQLTDITAIDYIEQKAQFEIVYNLLSMHYNQRLILSLFINENDQLDSITSVFESANWLEREIWDLFGINFRNHPDLRRILTDYNFGGHPLRKDFPVMGYGQVKYDANAKRVAYEAVNLDTPYRNFDFLSPWEGGAIKDDTTE